jgi:hypothetical protein
MKVFRQLSGFTYQAVAHDREDLMPSQLNTFAVNIAVQPGDVIGLNSQNAGAVNNACVFSSASSQDILTRLFTDLADGDSAGFTNNPSIMDLVNVSATLDYVPPPPPPPSNAITLGKPVLNRVKGTAVEPVDVPGPGSLTLTGKGLVAQRPARASVSRTVPAAGIVNLLVKSKGKTKKKLNKTGKAKVTLTITFTPTGGSAASKTKSIILKKTLRR